MRIAFLFPGQGAQKVGMGKDLYNEYEEVRNVFEDASRISGIDIATLCFNGIRKEYDANSYRETEDIGEDLSQTENTQLAIATMSYAILSLLKKEGIEAEISAGLSLGEYVALMYAGVITFEEGIKLLKRRGYLMQHEIPKDEYLMLAVIGIDSKVVEEVCTEVRNMRLFVVPANYNYSEQTVISGKAEAVIEAEKLLKEKGVKKVIRLKTSGPFHTSLLENAKKEFEKDLALIKYKIPTKKVLKNIDGTSYLENDNMPKLLGEHIVSSVRFDKIISNMKAEKIDTFIEIGPGKALTGFIKKEFQDVNVINISDVTSLKEALKILKEKGE